MHLILYHFITNDTVFGFLVQIILYDDQNEIILMHLIQFIFSNIFLISPPIVGKIVSLMRTSKLHSKYIIHPEFNYSIILNMISYRFRSFGIQT